MSAWSARYLTRRSPVQAAGSPWNWSW